MQKTLWTLRYHWKTLVFWLATIMALSVAYVATLEIPGPNSTQSGIPLISGWKCEANGPLTIRFDGGNATPLLCGSERGDTRKPKGPCDNANTGFIAILEELAHGQRLVIKVGRETGSIWLNRSAKAIQDFKCRAGLIY